MRISDWSSDVCSSDLIQRSDHLAVGAALVIVATRQRLLESMMVVDLAIDRERQRAIGGPNRLRPACRVDDGTALMDKQRAATGMHAAPVGTTMSLACRQRQIGRASRRAGVGQYVSLSVVAVSLKQINPIKASTQTSMLRV